MNLSCVMCGTPATDRPNITDCRECAAAILHHRRRLPAIVQSVTVADLLDGAAPAWVAGYDKRTLTVSNELDRVYVATADGVVVARRGECVVRGLVNDELYVRRADVLGGYIPVTGGGAS